MISPKKKQLLTGFNALNTIYSRLQKEFPKEVQRLDQKNASAIINDLL